MPCRVVLWLAAASPPPASTLLRVWWRPCDAPSHSLIHHTCCDKQNTLLPLVSPAASGFVLQGGAVIGGYNPLGFDGYGKTADCWQKVHIMILVNGVSCEP
jgi:hypothetical protein